MSDFDQVIAGEEWEETDLSLLETLDHVLNRGLVIAGEITISVADIDLIFVGLNVLVSRLRLRTKSYASAKPNEVIRLLSRGRHRNDCAKRCTVFPARLFD